MASCSSAPHHSRSNSLPTRLNLTVSQFDEQLNRIRSSESASSSSFSSITSKLTHLRELYDCLDEVLQLPYSQKAISCQGQEKWVEEGSIKLLDVCGVIIDVLMQMKERAQELQSIMRRRCSEVEISKQLAQYLKTKKMAIKVVLKALKDLKRMENMYSKESYEISTMSRRLRECQMVTFNVLESILVAIAGPKSNSQGSSWESVISKLMKFKRVSQQEKDLCFLGIETMDARQLEKIEFSIIEVEQGVQCLFRHLITLELPFSTSSVARSKRIFCCLFVHKQY